MNKRYLSTLTYVCCCRVHVAEQMCVLLGSMGGGGGGGGLVTD